MLYLGLDVHCKWFTVAGFELASGEYFQIKRVMNDPAAIAEAFAQLPSPREGALEAGTNALALYRILAPYFERLLIVSPGVVWDRRRNTQAKTDCRDAGALAVKLANGELKGIYLPGDAIREARSLVRGRLQVTQDITRLVNQLYALLRGWGCQVEKKALTKKGRAWLNEVRLPGHAATVLEHLLDRLDMLLLQQRQLEAEIVKEAAADPICRRLMTIPSVGPFTALALREEIGDISRFRSGDALINYSGLSPRVYQSSDRTRFGGLSKAGNALLRYVAVLFAQNVIRNRKETPFKERYRRLYHTHDCNEIKIILARDFLAVVHSMWRNDADWQWSSRGSMRETISVA